MQLQTDEDDLYHYGAYEGRVFYTLAAHISTHLLLFAKDVEGDTTGLQLRGYRLWVDTSGKGRCISTIEGIPPSQYLQNLSGLNTLRQLISLKD